MSNPGPISIDQGDYIAVLEDDADRERKTRLVLTAQLRSKERALAAYVARFGDITSTQEQGARDGDAAGTG